MTNRPNLMKGATAVAALCAAFLTGCATKTETPMVTQPTARPVETAPPPPASAPGFRTARAAFPTGNVPTSALLVEKTVPVEVLVGQPFDIVYKVTNLTDLSLRDVTLTDNTAENFRVEQSVPAATKSPGGDAVWMIGELPPKGSREVRIRGVALEEGFVTGCGSVTFAPYVCETVKVVKPAISLVKTMPEQVTQCDPIPVRLVVRNNGSSPLTNVRVTDSLPSGLLTETGQSSVAFDAGTLTPGEAKEFAFNAKASRTGTFANPAKATSAQGVEAEAEDSVTVVKPALTVACQTPSEKQLGNLRFVEFIGRPFDVCWTIENTGNAPSADTRLEVALPAGMSMRSATDGGLATGGSAVWNIGSLAPGATKKVCGTFSATAGGSYAFSATTMGICADPASTSCSVFIQGVNAILVEVVDDPDPIQVGEETTYTIRVTNQGGGLDLQDLTIKANFPDQVDPVTASNNGRIAGKAVTWPVVPGLPVKESVTYTVRGKAVAAGDARIEVEVTTRERQSPIIELESTTAY